MRVILAAVAALLLQEPDAAETRFRTLLERIEKTGLAVPELQDGVRELEKAVNPKLARELRDRFDVVRAQSAVLASLHAHLLKFKGGPFEIPVPSGKAVPVKLIDVTRRGVKISRTEGTQDFAWSEIDPEWILATAKPGFAASEAAQLWCGLWLAKAARWDAAVQALDGVKTDHPLAVEARHRGIDAAIATFDGMVRGKRWIEALARLEALDRLAPGHSRVIDARGRLLDAMVEHGKELCRKKSKGPMQEVIDLIAKHFPDGAPRIEDIREAIRWVKLTDPKKFKKLEAVKGPPWLLKAPEDGALTCYSMEPGDAYVGLSIKVRFEKGEKKSQGGMVWEDGHRSAWVSAESAHVCVASGNPGEVKDAYNYEKVSVEGPHTITLRIRDGHYILQHNGVEYDRAETKERTIGGFALNACYGKAWFDEVWVLKKE